MAFASMMTGKRHSSLQYLFRVIFLDTYTCNCRCPKSGCSMIKSIMILYLQFSFHFWKLRNNVCRQLTSEVHNFKEDKTMRWWWMVFLGGYDGLIVMEVLIFLCSASEQHEMKNRGCECEPKICIATIFWIIYERYPSPDVGTFWIQAWDTWETSSTALSWITVCPIWQFICTGWLDLC